MKAYCLDTSGLSTPLEFMPEDIHPSLWAQVRGVVAQDKFAVTTEIYGELVRLPGEMGKCIAENRDLMQLEIQQDGWDWETYLKTVDLLLTVYANVISEYNGGRVRTVCVNDMSIIALAKTLRLPVISSEKRTPEPQRSDKRLKIPDVCDLEGVAHMDFNDFLRAEGFSV